VDPISALTGILQSLSVLLILGGIVTAFLWKLSAILNIIVGVLLSIVLTYVVYTLTHNLVGTAIMFIVGLGITGVLAALAAIACILEGFTFSAIGFWGLLIGSSPSIAFSSGTIVEAIIGSIVSTGIAAFIGGRVFSTRTLNLGKKQKNTYSNKPKVSYQNTSYYSQHNQTEPSKVKIIPEKEIKKADLMNEFPKEAVLIDREFYQDKKKRTQKQLDKLYTEVEKGKIDKVLSLKFETELKDELKSIDKEFKDALKGEIADHERELSELESQISSERTKLDVAESEKTILLKEKTELEARFSIRRISRSEFHDKNNKLSKKISNMDSLIKLRNMRMQKLREQQTDAQTSFSRIKSLNNGVF
jgi:hypothetical protein